MTDTTLCKTCGQPMRFICWLDKQHTVGLYACDRCIEEPSIEQPPFPDDIAIGVTQQTIDYWKKKGWIR